MTRDQFFDALDNGGEPAMPPLLLALWYDRRGNWNRAHAIAQEVRTSDGAWVHAYLHRREGDVGNAGYWYDRAGRGAATDSLDAEWNRLVDHLVDSLRAAE